jgi:anti-sigma B factor antagonist
MELHSESYGPVELVSLPERLVMANAQEARAALKRLIVGGRHRLVLDLQPVDFIDSSGLSVLISALKELKPCNGSIVLLKPSDGVRALIELTRLHQVFAIYEDRDAALHSLAADKAVG